MLDFLTQLFTRRVRVQIAQKGDNEYGQEYTMKVDGVIVSQKDSNSPNAGGTVPDVVGKSEVTQRVGNYSRDETHQYTIEGSISELAGDVKVQKKTVLSSDYTTIAAAAAGLLAVGTFFPMLTD